MMMNFSVCKLKKLHYSYLRILRSYADGSNKSIPSKFKEVIKKNHDGTNCKDKASNYNMNCENGIKSSLNHSTPHSKVSQFQNCNGIIRKTLNQEGISVDSNQTKQGTTSINVLNQPKICEKPLPCMYEQYEPDNDIEYDESALSVEVAKPKVFVLGEVKSTFNSGNKCDVLDPCEIVSVSENIAIDFPCNSHGPHNSDNSSIVYFTTTEGNTPTSGSSNPPIGGQSSHISGQGKDPCMTTDPPKIDITASKDDCKDKKEKKADPCKKEEKKADLCKKEEKKADPCKKEEKKKDPCKKEEKKADPCKKDEKKKDPCKKEEKKADPCKKEEKKADPCKKDEKKKDPCKKEEKKADPCKKEEKKADPCKKDEKKKDPCKKEEKKADPCKKDEKKKDPCKKEEKKADPCKKEEKKADPCKKDEKKKDPCKKEEKKKDVCKKEEKKADACKKEEKKKDACKKDDKKKEVKKEAKPDECKEKNEKKEVKKEVAKPKKPVCKPPPKCHRRSGPKKKSHALFWRNLSLFAAIPFALLLTGYIFSTREEIERPEFVKYEYLRRRTKPFPWGDGNHSLFHNPRVNPLPDGYEDEEGDAEGGDGDHHEVKPEEAQKTAEEASDKAAQAKEQIEKDTAEAKQEAEKKE